MRHRAPIIVITAGLLAGGAVIGLHFQSPLARATPTVPLPSGAAWGGETSPLVIAPGRIAPDGGIIRIGAPIDLGASVVSQLLVSEGERVEPGQMLAILETHAAAEAALHVAECHRDAVRARLEDARSGTAASLIRVKAAALAAARIKLQYARRQLARTQPLLAAGDVAAEKNDQSAQDVASDAAYVAQAESEQAEAQAAYANGVTLAAADLAEAEAAVEQAQANLERTVLRAPRAAQVLRIIAHAGEQIGLDGLAEIGDTRQLYAVADVYEADAPMLRLGQHATVTGRALAGAEPATVAAIGLLTRPRRMEGVDPEDARGGRVVEVRLRFDHAVPAIIGSEVRVAIRATQAAGMVARLCDLCAPGAIDVGAR